MTGLGLGSVTTEEVANSGLTVSAWGTEFEYSLPIAIWVC